MPKRLLTEATVEPVSLQEAKRHCVIETDEHDVQISSLIVAARRHVEKRTGRAIARQKWRLSFSYFPVCIPAEPEPVMSVAAVQYIDADGVTQTVDAADYELNQDYRIIRPVYGVTWPASRGDFGSVWADVWSGYASASGSPQVWTSNAPADLTVAMLLLIKHLWKNRESETDLELYHNHAFELLIDPYWIPTA